MTAWMEGHRAEQSGNTVDVNPHRKGTDNWWAWRAGWYFLGVNEQRERNMFGQSYEDRRDMIATHAWEKWTKNGLNLDDEMRQETEKTVQDAVNNTYTDDISDTDWLAATLARLAQ